MPSLKYFHCVFYTALFVISSSFGQTNNTVLIKVNGLTCSLCSKAVEKKMILLPFVRTVKMDLNSNEALVAIDFSQKVDWNQLAKSVYDAGFSIGYFQVPSCKNTDQQFYESECNDNYNYIGAPDKHSNSDFYILVGKYFMTPKAYSIWKKKMPNINLSVSGKTIYNYY